MPRRQRTTRDLTSTHRWAAMRHFGADTPLREALSEVPIFPSAEDQRRAVAGDCMNCVVARYLERATESPKKPLVFRGVAYVLLPDKGKLFVERFQIPKELQAVIRFFDKTKKWPKDERFELRPPTESQTLAAEKARRNKSKNAPRVPGAGPKRDRKPVDTRRIESLKGK